MHLCDISVVREIMARHNITFQKKFGQNFLINPQIPKRIAESACDVENDGTPLGILEIGPGIGTLTRELSCRANKVVALEIDTGLIPVLSETLADCDNTTVINQDVMKTDLAELVEREFFSKGMRVCVAANLPYYITTPILMKLLESKLPFEAITVMIQKEVAQRLCAPAGNSEYGAITASLGYYGKCERLFTVSAGCFMPAPKVDSAVVKITLHKTPPVDILNEEFLFKAIRGGFAQRRKTLSNSLMSEFSNLGRDMVTEAIINAGIDPKVRGEQLNLENYGRLADELYRKSLN